MIAVISTTYAPPADARAKCIASVPASAYHFYIDAERQDPPLSHFENLLFATENLPDDAIVACLDGDDWLTPGALEHVQAVHDAGALVTYGSFRYADGRPGFARELTPEELANPRQAPWVSTHLKTFRAGLLRRIDIAHLRRDGRWLEHARDMALMYPLLEMAGERAVYIPEVLYIYNYANSTEHRGGVDVLAAEREAVHYVRGLPRYEAL